MPLVPPGISACLHTDTVLLDRLLRSSRSFDLRELISVNKEVDPIRLYARIETSEVDFVLVHCQSYRCYGIVKKVMTCKLVLIL